MQTKSQAIVTTMTSLVQSMHNAGGEPELRRVLQMSVFDFIMDIAGPNSIQFHFMGDRNETVLTNKNRERSNENHC